ncbi:MAG: hypothetical protein LBV72_14310 [Tannerella sp.]|jgi:hypothetical protein|nr:hypothetical protein [Tannerella sp.]
MKKLVIVLIVMFASLENVFPMCHYESNGSFSKAWFTHMYLPDKGYNRNGVFLVAIEENEKEASVVQFNSQLKPLSNERLFKLEVTSKGLFEERYTCEDEKGNKIAIVAIWGKRDRSDMIYQFYYITDLENVFVAFS